ncbi:hypothetical protein DFH07DRAFT_783553 [Mycena maculata]|uniref:Uncharacterized protein n=1 Tax=Mycena maculata TaxID=230809 RepID=A0AAD7MMG0_9AGAR|nr:hypothetical protein DFH07DRAFT_783553 [Mycena maculata]
MLWEWSSISAVTSAFRLSAEGSVTRRTLGARMIGLLIPRSLQAPNRRGASMDELALRTFMVGQRQSEGEVCAGGEAWSTGIIVANDPDMLRIRNREGPRGGCGNKGNERPAFLSRTYEKFVYWDVYSELT